MTIFTQLSENKIVRSVLAVVVGFAATLVAAAALLALCFATGSLLHDRAHIQFVGFGAADAKYDPYVTHSLNGLLALAAVVYTVAALLSLMQLVLACIYAPSALPGALTQRENPYALLYWTLEDELPNDRRYVVDKRVHVIWPLYILWPMSIVGAVTATQLLVPHLFSALAGVMGLVSARLAHINSTNCTLKNTFVSVASQCFSRARDCQCAQLGAIPAALFFALFFALLWICVSPARKQAGSAV